MEGPRDLAQCSWVFYEGDMTRLWGEAGALDKVTWKLVPGMAWPPRAWSELQGHQLPPFVFCVLV